MANSRVMTVRGPIDVAELGTTLMHEHILMDMTREVRHGGILNDVPTAVAELDMYVKMGGASIVDLTSRGLGGHPSALPAISKEVRANIILGTGFYRQPYFDSAYMDRTSTGDLADLFVRDIELGIDGSAVRAGIIGEIGCDQWLTSQEERVFRAAAIAHLRTGLSISTHAARWPVGRLQLDLLMSCDVPADRIIVGHCDLVSSAEWSGLDDVFRYHLDLAEAGAFVEFDTIWPGNEYRLDRRVDYVKNMIAHGHLEQVLLSQDVCTQGHLAINGGGGYSFILKEFGPRLIAAGVTDDQLDTILVKNPARALTGVRV